MRMWTVCVCVVLLASVCVAAQPSSQGRVWPAPPPPAPMPVPSKLPQAHEYQKQLRAYMATLTEKDFDVEAKPFTVPPGQRTTEEEFKARILADKTPHFMEGILRPSSEFTLAAIESNEGVRMPGIAPDGVGWLAAWNFAGNPYYNSRPIKLRAFVAGAVDLIMHDYGHELPDKSIMRSDYMGGTLIWLAYAYKSAADAVPPQARGAYAEGLKKMVRRLNEWGPLGSMTDMDLFAAVSMRMVSDAVKDPEITKIAEAYVKRLYTDPRFYNQAGYFVDNSCFDTSYNGISLYFTVFAALQARDWTFISDALNQSYKLKGHLMFPEVGGGMCGPSSCSARTSNDPAHDQWCFPPRDLGASMLGDNAVFLTKLPTAAQLAGTTEKLIKSFNASLESGVGSKGKKAQPGVWGERHWSPAVNPAYDFYVPGYYDRRAKLEAENSPFLKNPYDRGGDFIEQFGKAFLIAKLGDYAVAIHTGPVGPRLFGWGGGNICAFWTRKSGPVMLGRRRGFSKQTHNPDESESIESWRLYPIHAVSGITADGQMFTSARIREPNVVFNVSGRQRAEVRVEGVIPKDAPSESTPYRTSDVHYGRVFVVDESGVTVTTSIKGDGKDMVSELYETLPVYLGDGAKARDNVKIAFLTAAQTPDPNSPKGAAKATPAPKAGEKWVDATSELQDAVSAVRVTRHDGTILITFSAPARLKLSPEVWADHYQSSAQCRTILVDLLAPYWRPQDVPTTSISYKITVVKK